MQHALLVLLLLLMMMMIIPLAIFAASKVKILFVIFCVFVSFR